MPSPRNSRAKYLLRPGVIDRARLQSLGRSIPNDDPLKDKDYLEKGVESGEFRALEIVEDGQPVGVTIFKMIDRPGGKECLSVATHADGETDTTKHAMPILEEFAKSEGCKSIRLHTVRTGLVEKLTASGWYVSEIVMRKELS